jgi:hypothetical protein
LIDRGALLVQIVAEGSYRGVQRSPLDAFVTGKQLRALREQYRAAIVDGEGVLTDLDEAVAMLSQARASGTPVELIVFEQPQEPLASRTSLPLAIDPPAENLVLLGYDVIELIEPFCSAIAQLPGGDELNENGLLPSRSAADGLATTLNAQPDLEDPYFAVRVWLYL